MHVSAGLYSIPGLPVASFTSSLVIDSWLQDSTAPLMSSRRQKNPQWSYTRIRYIVDESFDETLPYSSFMHLGRLPVWDQPSPDFARGASPSPPSAAVLSRRKRWRADTTRPPPASSPAAILLEVPVGLEESVE